LGLVVENASNQAGQMTHLANFVRHSAKARWFIEIAGLNWA
jgi:hypothetical protein